MRERRNDFFLLLEEYRITPARAGKTIIIRCRSSRCRDHPRSCGKDLSYHVRPTFSVGSPPLVRERHNIKIIKSFYLGITPARAGKTQMRLYCLLTRRDHPRSCGKDIVSFRFIIQPPGSPPLVRERLHIGDVNYPQSRITPARAGKTY